MNAERWASFLKGDQSDYLGARTVAHGSTFLAVRLDGTENRSKTHGNLTNVG